MIIKITWILLVVSVVAVISTVDQDVFDFEQENVHLHCSLNNPTWTKNDKSIGEKDDKHYEKIENNTLIVKKIGKDSGGVYICSAGDVTENITLNVRPHIRKFDKPKNLIQGDPLQLECKGYGYPTPVVQWFHNRTLILPDGDRITLKDTAAGSEGGVMINGTVRITKTKFDDGGIYICEATNEFNTTSAEVTVQVKNMWDAVWPFLGICAEVAILCTIIFIYEKRRNKRMQEEENRASEEVERLNANNEVKTNDGVRQRI